MREEVIAAIERDHIYRSASQGRRLDGRALDEHRRVEIEVNPIKTAEGSARVRMGNADVIVGVKMALGAPFPDRPNDGVMTTVAELRPVAYQYFETGPPRPESIEIARVIDRGVRESKMIDMAKLCVEEGVKVWVAFIDIHAINHDGNLIGAGGLAALAALMNTTVPAKQFGIGEDFPLPIEHYPIPVTSVKFGSHIAVDPTAIEETVAECRLTTTFDEEGALRAMQKGGDGAFTRAEIDRIVSTNSEVSNTIRKYIGAGT
ncbi:MAG: exosome complex protein Rrp42 [Thermoplasmata archaeon]|nr:exosome complex protein Rrp42 [Thermoplasmata archaeon]